MGSQTFVACIIGSPGSFWWRVSFPSGPDFPSRNILKHPETSWNQTTFSLMVLYEMGSQTFVARMTGSSGSFCWRVSFHSDPDFLSRNISKHPETSWNQTTFSFMVLHEMCFQTFVARITGWPGSFWWRVSFHSGPDFLSQNISKHPETSWNRLNHFQPLFLYEMDF